MEQIKHIYTNGVSGVTGTYLLEPIKTDWLASLIMSRKEGARAMAWLRRVFALFTGNQQWYGDDFDPLDLSQTGWGIVFHAGESRAVKNALRPLIEHRKGEVGWKERLHVLEYHDGDDPRSWLQRFSVAPGIMEPERVPYYLLVVGGPDRIPFSFTSLLAAEYAVGRIHFDTVAGYRAYAESIVAYEQSSTVFGRQEVAYFAPRHPSDIATQLSADHLVSPLAVGLNNRGKKEPVAAEEGYVTNLLIGEDAKRSNLLNLLGQDSGPPALLFTASHGVGWPLGHARYAIDQGALLCQDWEWEAGHIIPEHYLSAGDITNDLNIHGMVVFSFACFSAGTPLYDRFHLARGSKGKRIAEEATIAPLPKSMLARQNGALAWVGHVDRAWGYSIAPRNVGPKLQPFRKTIRSILRGERIGHALQAFRERYVQLSTHLAGAQERRPDIEPLPSEELAALWIERNDAEGYLVIGDPAVRLRLRNQAL